MSTRGVIARPKGDGWEGVYHHSDSYPTGLGADLWGQLAGVEDAELLVTVALADGEEPMDSETASALHIEWVYVLSGHTLTLLGQRPTEGWTTMTAPTGQVAAFRDWTWRLVWQGDLRGVESDWAALEAEHRAFVAALPYATDLVREA